MLIIAWFNENTALEVDNPCCVIAAIAAITSSKLTPACDAVGATSPIEEDNSSNVVLPLSTPKNKISFIFDTSSAEYPHAFITVVKPSTTVNKSEAPA